MKRHFPVTKDRALVQIVDAALADAVQRSGKWLVCRPGCSQCCVGVFPINQLDASRLKRGLAEMQSINPDRADRVRERARVAMARLSASFPGEPVNGILNEDEADGRFLDFGNHEVCPALDPETGACELYASRPMTCRVFGPPVRSEGGLGVCELCFQGATTDPDDLESTMLEELENSTGIRRETIVAHCLAS
jgi:Fe-S-cluster containining protein